MVKISVIMPVYNSEEFLSDALDSILNQDLKDIEIICVNDESTDGSLNIINDYANKYDFIKVFTKENEGSGIARNYALRKANGEYIAFLDSDDVYLEKNALRKMYEAGIENNSNMVSANLKGINTDGTLEINRNLERFQSESFISPKNYGIPYSFYKNIFKKSFLVENNITFPDLLRGQDPVFLAEILTLIDKILTVPVDLYGFRYSDTSDLIKMNTYKKRYDYIKHFKDTFEILTDAGFNEMKKKYENKLIEYITAFHNRYTKEVKDIFLDVFNDDEYMLNLIKPLFIKPKVSVIIYINNNEKNLSDSLEIILNQSLKEIEIICIDNNSNDISLNILKEFSLKDSRIRIFNHEFSLKFAKKQAESDYIYFFNINDKIDKDSIETAYCNILKNGTDLVIFKSDSFTSNGIGNKTYFNYNNILDSSNYNKFTYKNIKNGIFSEGYLLESKMYKKELIETDNILLVHLTSILNAGKISFVDKILYHHNPKLTNQVNLEKIDELEKFLKDKNLFDDLKKEFYLLKFDEILQKCFDEKSYQNASDIFNEIDRSYLKDNKYFLDSYDLFMKTDSFNDFKLKFQLLSLENEIKNNKIAIHMLKKENKKLKEDKIRLQKVNNTLLNSRSWKLTKTFRKLKNR